MVMESDIKRTINIHVVSIFKTNIFLMNIFLKEKITQNIKHKTKMSVKQARTQ